MIVFMAIQMSVPKRKSPQSVIIKLRIKGINVFELSFTLVHGKERVHELTECQNDNNQTFLSTNHFGDKIGCKFQFWLFNQIINISE